MNKEKRHRTYLKRRTEEIRKAREWQMANPEKVREYKRVFNQAHPMAKRYYNLKNKSRADMELAIDEFYQWYDAEPKKCYYCDIPINLLEIPDSYINRKSSGLLTIDRKNPKGNYAKGNMVLACQLCNLVKSNFFSADIMKELAQRYIKPRWQVEAGIEPNAFIPDDTQKIFTGWDLEDAKVRGLEAGKALEREGIKGKIESWMMGMGIGYEANVKYDIQIEWNKFWQALKGE